MARGKVQMKRIENPVHRQVTFCKRRAGLLKKAKELSVLCDAEIGVFIFSSHGKLFELATKGSMQGLIERYMKMKPTRVSHAEQTVETETLDAKKEINLLKQEIEILQKGLRYMFDGGAGTMTLDELQVLEKNLEIWIYHVRSAKKLIRRLSRQNLQMDILFQEIQLLRNSEEVLTAANKYLQDKIEENTEVTNFIPMATDNTYPLTIPDDIFEC
ncbi:agamous-like MADS-box protein AGL12 [Pyrus ussuriensis x Pyrus communis]|uniref:Agamous-like MADS-box protein AGL12 n=1 Tax=Pyrus ussuriensis x Pyrus communis TaxID=2448454 RepID=A0A5N5F060_9ROSA|nr:agamous-like MADS-box protein AGL12 [Pyrus ussuriensis x Pyrus communis]